MDVKEKKVVRRKTPVMAEILNFSPASQKEYKDRGLLTEDMISKIMVEKTNKNKIYRFLDLLTKEKLEAPFSKLVELLEDQGHRWLRFEMSSDLKAEKLEMMVDEYVYRESGILVHSHFGQCARISEIDKKDIQLMLSWRFQIAKDAWSSQLEGCERDIKELKQYQQNSEEKIKKADRQIDEFLEKYVQVLDVRAESLLKTSKEAQRKSPKKKAGGEQCEKVLGDYFDEFMNMLDKSSQRLADLEEARNNCAAILNVTDPSVPIDIALRSTLNAQEQLTMRAQQEAAAAQERADAMEAELNALKGNANKELEEKDKKVLQMQTIMTRANDKNKELANITTEFLRKRKESQNDAKTWRERCLMLEKTRKLGYFNPGWYDQLYGICDVHYVRDTKERKRPPTEKIISPQCRCTESSLTMTRPKSAAGVNSGVTSRCSTPVTVSTDSGGQTNPRKVLRNSRSQAKINSRSSNSEYSTVYGLKNASNIWKDGKIPLKKNSFSKSGSAEEESPPTKTACKGLKCNYLYESSKNCDKQGKINIMSTI